MDGVDVRVLVLVAVLVLVRVSERVVLVNSMSVQYGVQWPAEAAGAHRASR